MLPSFNVRKTLSRSVNVDPDDVLKLKSTLSGLGHYKVPKWGITPYPDQDLFRGVEGFQKKNKLKIDGVLKPGGPTEKKLNKTLARGIVTGEWDWMKSGDPFGAFNEETKTKARIKKDALPSMQASYAPKGDGTGTHDPKPDEKDTRLALGPGAALYPIIAGGIRLAPKVLRELGRLYGAGEAARKLEEAAKKGKGDKTKIAPRTTITSPPPPVPPTEPLKEKDKLPQKEEYPANSPELPGRPENIPPNMGDDFEIYPELDEEIRNFGLIVENSRGNPLTQAETNKIIKMLDEGMKKRGVNETHTGGGQSVEGNYMKERYIKPSGVDGAARPDGSFEIKRNNKPKSGSLILDFNTVDTWKDGTTPTARERRAIEKIIRLKKSHKEDGDILAFPKSKNYGREDWSSDMQEVIDIYLDVRFGKKKDK